MPAKYKCHRIRQEQSVLQIKDCKITIGPVLKFLFESPPAHSIQIPAS